jgi:exosortase K
LKTKTSIIFYIPSILVFLLLKWWYRTADNDDLYFFLFPVDSIIQFFTNSSSQYDLQNGFNHPLFNVTIDKSCSGFNFWMIAFLVFYYSLVNNARHFKIQLLALPISLLLAYVSTLIANSARILSLLIIEQKLQLINQSLHQGVGAFIYLSFLVIFYLILNYLLNHKANAKLTQSKMDTTY